MKPRVGTAKNGKTSQPDTKATYNFVQLMKEVENVTKEPKPKPEPHVLSVTDAALDFTKDYLTNDQFGDLLQAVKPPPKDKGNKVLKYRGPKSAKTVKKEINEKNTKTPFKKATQPQKLKTSVIVEPVTIDDLIRQPLNSSDDDIMMFEQMYRPKIIPNPFKEESVDKKTITKPKKQDLSSFESRNKEYLEKKQKKLDKIKEEMEPTFKPSINKKSELIEKRKTPSGVSRAEKLYNEEYIQKRIEMNNKQFNWASGL